MGGWATVWLIRQAPGDWRGPTGPAMLRAHVFAPTASPRSYLCGRTGFVEAAATALVDLGHNPSWIRLERSARSVD